MKAWMMQGIFIGHVFLAWNQNVVVELSAQPEKANVNEVIKITVKSNDEGDIIENWPSEFIKLQRVQSSWQYIQEVKSGSAKQEHTVVFSGSFKKKGTYNIGPFYLKTEKNTYTSNVLTIEVIDASQNRNIEHITYYPAKKKVFGTVYFSDSIVYEGEPVVVCGKVYSKERTFGSPILKRNYTVNGVNDIHPIVHDHQWETVKIKDTEYSSFIFEKKVFFPTGNKTITAKPFDIYLPYGVYGVHVRSLTSSLRVLPLPADPPSNFIGAVGQFEVNQKCKSKKIKIGDIIEIEVEVSGQGNLHAIETPKVNFPKNMTTYGTPHKYEEYQFCSNGAKGKITYVYPVQVDKEGTQVIPPVSIAYFDPKLKKYVQTSANKAIEMNVEHIQTLQITDLSSQKSTKDISSDEIVATNIQHANKGTKNWVWSLGTSLSIVMCSGLIFLVVKRKRRNAAKINETDIDLERSNNSAYMAQVVNDLIHQTTFYYKEQQKDKFYMSMEKSLIAVLKFKVQEGKDSTLSRYQLLNKLREIHQSHAESIERMFKECEAARYGQITSQVSQEKMLEELRRIV